MLTQKFSILLILLLLTPISTSTSFANQSSITVKTKILKPDNSEDPNTIQNIPKLRTSSTTLDTKNQRIIMVGQNIVSYLSEIWEFSLEDSTWKFLTIVSEELHLNFDDIFYNPITNQVIIIAYDTHLTLQTHILTENNEISRVEIFHGFITQTSWTEYLFIEKYNYLFAFGGRTVASFYDTTRIYDFNNNEWILVDTSIAPSSRVLHSMIYDPVTEQIVLFGGFVGITSDGFAYIENGDTWIFNFKTLLWTEIIEEISPNSRARSRLVYDPSSNLVILFGGSSTNGTIFYDDLWSFDIETYHWNLINNSLGIGVRGLPSIDYIASSKSIILSGGFHYDQVFHFYNDTWEISILYPPKDSIFDFNKMIIPLVLFMVGLGLIVILAIIILRKGN